MERKSCFRVTRSRQQAQFFAALDGLGAAGGSELVEGAGTVCLDGVFGNEKLRGDLAIAEAAGDQGEDFELACRDAEGLLLGRIGSEGFESGAASAGTSTSFTTTVSRMVSRLRVMRRPSQMPKAAKRMATSAL
jgi:hypothetical protein